MSETILSRIAVAIAIAFIQISSANAQQPDAWVPPIGIPAPAFGIDDSHTMYAGQNGYSDAGNGPYTHYIDNSAGCSDSGNPNGSPGSPRCSVPTTLAAGTVVEIHGGPYTDNGTIIWNINGTPLQPVFVRGTGANARPEFIGPKIQLIGSYGIVEYIDGNQVDVEWPGPSDHISLRHSHIHDHPGTGAIVDNGQGTFTVIYNNEINNHGVIPSAKDRHGIFSGPLTDNVWIVDNHIHHNSGDAIQFCHGCVGNGTGPSNIYIGRNLMHHDEENAIDLKEFIGPVIISENTIHSYVTGPFSGSGEAIRINDEGSQGAVWLIYNDVSASNVGIQPNGSNANVYIIGNILHDIQEAAIGPDGDFAINNTIYNTVDGFMGGGEFTSNIIYNASRKAVDSRTTSCSNNLIDSGSIDTNCANTVVGDPQFIFDTTSKLVGIGPSSPAIGSGLGDHAVYQTFQTQFGVDIRIDANGSPRPIGVPWAAGAHEDAGSGVQPLAPTNLIVN